MSRDELQDLRIMVMQILKRPMLHDWTVQGFGMMRLYLEGDRRLHLWHPRLRVENVSDIHDHLQWGLTSTILCGELVNKRFHEHHGGGILNSRRDVHTMMKATLKPGVGTFFKNGPSVVTLIGCNPELYHAGDRYHQRPNEIHLTQAHEGTITLMRKHPTEDESATVYWPAGANWVSAEPRPATTVEIEVVTERALFQLKKESGLL